MGETFYPANDYRNYLAHFGVKGMKWGVRKDRNRSAKGNFYRVSSAGYDLQSKIFSKLGAKKMAAMSRSVSRYGAKKASEADAAKAAGRKKKGFWKQRKENFQNMRRYNEMKSQANKKYNLDRLQWEADNEDARNTAARAMTNETLSRMGSYKGMSPDYNPYGTKARDTYRKAKADAARYADDTYKRKYGAERLSQAKKSNTAYDSLALLASLGITAGGAVYSANKKRR